MLPMKFIDTVKHDVFQALFEDGLKPTSNLQQQILSHQSDREQGLIRQARKECLRNGDIDGMVEILNSLYFEEFGSEDRQILHKAARIYLQHGGTFQTSSSDDVKNELVRSHFLLYLYKELASHENVKEPSNLHRLSSLAASRAGEELNFKEISDQLGVDRRTVDSYLATLEQGKAVSESHDFSLQRHRRTPLFLRNPRHVVLLSQRQEHHGFESFSDSSVLNPEFEYKLARTVGFDHAQRLSWRVPGPDADWGTVEYTETESGVVDFILHREGLVLPFILSSHPRGSDAETIAIEFEPEAGKHPAAGDQLRDLDYHSPYGFIITDSLPGKVRKNGSSVVEREGVSIRYIPYWLFLLLC